MTKSQDRFLSSRINDKENKSKAFTEDIPLISYENNKFFTKRYDSDLGSDIISNHGEMITDCVADNEKEKKDLYELLNYYRSRCADFDSERKEYLEKFSSLETSHETIHRLKWEVKMRKEEIIELQKALGAANASIFEHKEKILELQAESDALKIQEMEDRKRIQHLLALTQPVTEEVTFFRDCRPGRMTRFAVNTASIEEEQTHENNSKRNVVPRSKGLNIPNIGIQSFDDNKHPFSIQQLDKKQEKELAQEKKITPKTNQLQAKQSRVLRTVYLPSEQADSLMKTVQMLKVQLTEQKDMYEERIKSLSGEKSISGTCSDEKYQEMQNRINELQAAVSKAEDTLRHTTKDYLVTRHNAQEAERSAHEEIAELRSLVRKLTQEKTELKRQAHIETIAIKEAIQEEGNLCAEEFRKQVVDREQDVYILKEQYKAVQVSYNTRINDLQTRLRKLKARYKALEQRRCLEIEGFNNDVNNLKKHLHRLESAHYGNRMNPKDRNSFSNRGNNQKPVMASEITSEISNLQKRFNDLETDISRYYE